MLEQICLDIHNFFVGEKDILLGDFTIESGAITSPDFRVEIAENQYYRIVGSLFNDGVHHYDDELIDEGPFHGGVWLMRVPQAIIDLAAEIEDWQERNAEAIDSPYQSESFGGYTYSKGANADGTTGADWKTQASFMKRLQPYRRIRIL